MPKFGIIAHLPASRGFTASFLKNLESYKTRYPIHLYSDSPEFGVPVVPEPKQAVGFRNLPMAANNYVMLKGLEIAIKNQLDYFLYLEEDCRVATDFWDERIFNEFMLVDGAVMGGTPSIFNVGLCGHEAASAGIRFADKVLRQTGRPPLMWSSGARPGDQAGFFVFPNGAGGVYHTATIAAVFASSVYDVGTFCANLPAWDMHFGQACGAQFGIDVVGRFAIIPSVYSGYRDVHYNLNDRKRMLESGEVCLIHQVKEQWP